jgi:hypothetical protein
VKSREPDGMPPAGTVVLATASELSAAVAAICAGAGLIDLWNASQETAAAVRARYPGVLACARADWADLVRDRAIALRTGAILICGDPTDAARAEVSGISRDAILVEAPPALAAGLMAAGWQVVVDADEMAGPHAAAAVGAIACWLGAAAVRTSHVAAIRRAIDMTASIRGTRPLPDDCYVRP